MTTYLSQCYQRCYNKECTFCQEHHTARRLSNGEMPWRCKNKSKHRGEEYILECEERISQKRQYDDRRDRDRLKELLKTAMDEKYDAISKLPVKEQIEILSECKTSLFYEGE